MPSDLMNEFKRMIMFEDVLKRLMYEKNHVKFVGSSFLLSTLLLFVLDSIEQSPCQKLINKENPYNEKGLACSISDSASQLNIYSSPFA